MWTWEEVVEKFLKKYFPESKTAKGKVEKSKMETIPDCKRSEIRSRKHNVFLKGVKGQRRKVRIGYGEDLCRSVHKAILNDQSIQHVTSRKGLNKVVVVVTSSKVNICEMQGFQRW